MNSSRFSRLREIFGHARELAEELRDDYLSQACGDDADLRIEVEELLAEDAAAHASAIDRVLSPNEEQPPTDPRRRPARTHPTTIGSYRILGVCGSGGMGVVYEAEQSSPRRRVALKVVPSAILVPELLRRFRREAQILATLQHPGIAQIFEAGESEEDGVRRPFIAMEFVEGEPLLEYATQRSLGMTERIEIFLRICEAIEYAHQKDVVHRDLKPDNILVIAATQSAASDAVVAGHPKVLDFGVARLAGSDTRLTMATGDGQLLGSVPYMSPEQALGDPANIDARSDVYALGVLLFELLSGELPYPVVDRSLVDALHTIRHRDPSRLGSVVPALRGDLETIVGKCLEKERSRRYQSVATLAEDLRSYLVDAPILARPPSTLYMLRRFAQRHRALAAALVLSGLALIVGAGFSLAYAIKANEQAAIARRSQARSERDSYRANIGVASVLLEDDPQRARRVLSEIPEDQRGWEWRYLSSALSSVLHEFGRVAEPYLGEGRVAGFLDPTRGFGILAGGEQVLGLAAPDEFRIWEIWTGREVRSLPVPGEVVAFAAARDGSLLAAALRGGRVVGTDPRSERPQWETWNEGADEVQLVAVEPSGDRVAVYRPTALWLGRPDGGREVEPPAPPELEFNPPRLAFSPDGARLVLARGNLLQFDGVTLAPIEPEIRSDQLIWSVAFSPSGSTLAGGHFRREIRLYDPATGDFGIELLGHQSAVHQLAYGGEDRLLSVAGSAIVRVWDLESQAQIAVLSAPGTTQAAFVDDEHILSLTAGRFRLWTLRDRRVRELVGHDGHVFCSAFSGDSGLLATSAPWAGVCVWDPLETRPISKLSDLRLEGFAFDQEAEQLVSFRAPYVGRGGTWFRSWAGGARENRAEQSGLSHAARHPGRLFVSGTAMELSGSEFGTYRTEHRIGDGVDAGRAFFNGAFLGSIEGPPRDLGPHPMFKLGGNGHSFSGQVAELAIFDGRLEPVAATALEDYFAARRRGAEVEFPNFDRSAGAALVARFRADRASLRFEKGGGVVSWTAANDQDLVLEGVGYPASVAKLVDATPTAPAHLKFIAGWALFRSYEVALPQLVSAEDVTICWLGAYGGRDERYQTCYGLGTLKIPFTDSTCDRGIHKVGSQVAKSPDGRFVACQPWALDATTIVLRDATTGALVHEFSGRYFSSSFHPDSRRLAAAREDGKVDIFEIPSCRRIAQFTAHGSKVFDAEYSPDGTRLATAGNDNAVRVWDTEHYEPVLDLPGHRSYVRSVRWSPDGSMLVSTCGDYVVRVWDAAARSERFAQRLANRERMDAVRSEVEVLRRAHESPEEAIAAIVERWSGDPLGKRAALRVFAQGE